MLQRQNLDGSWLYAYTADGERLLVQDQVNDRQLWTIRDLSGKVLSEYEAVDGTWTLTRDTLYRDGQLLATGPPREYLTHYHLDHLGTPRLLLGPPDSTTTPDPQAAGPNTYLVGRHNYFPFGEEATDSSQNPLRHRFTGHERDQLDTPGTTDDLDYMHARYYNPMLGRFLSPDLADAAEPTAPQTWNRYAYARNNPMNMVDPDGRVAVFTHEQMARNAEIRAEVQAKLSAIPLIGKPLAGAVDMVLSNYLPKDLGEHQAGLQAAVFSAVRLPTSANIGKLGQKLENIFQQNLTRATATAAGIESRGGVVALKATGEAFDHVKKFTEARVGVTKALNTLKTFLGKPGLTDRERAYVQYLIRKYSKQLDQLESIYQKAAEGFTPPPT